MITKPTPRAVLLVMICLGAIIPAVLVLRGSGETTAGPLYTVRRLSLDVVVHALGDLDSEKAVTVGSELREEAKIVSLVDDGARVNAGDVLVRFDPAPFEEKVSLLTSKVNELSALLAAQEQALEWEKLQAERETNTAEVDQRISLLELQKLDGGDGPLELSRLEGAMLDARKKHEEYRAYLKDLTGLAEKGYVNATEVSQATEEATKLQKTFDIALQQFESYKSYVLPSLLNSARAKLERARMLVDQAGKAGGLKIGKSVAELNQSKQELQNQRGLLTVAQAQLERTLSRAPQAGLAVLREGYQAGEYRKPRVGDKILPGQPLVFLPDVSNMMARVLVREVDLSKVGVGKPAVVNVDSYPEAQFLGGVTFIGVLAERRQEIGDGEKYFKVNISLSTKDERLRPGMTARARIVSQQGQEDVLAVPVYSVFEKDGRFHCFAKIRGGFEMREVALGRQNDEMAQVVKGLSEGEEISLTRPAPEFVVRTKPL